LLHGFPESAHTWRHQIPALAEAGYRVIAPDQRGYGRSSAPLEAAAYRRSTLIADLTSLLDALQIPQVTVISHDSGGAIGWNFAETHPNRVLGLVVLNCPHPSVLAKALRESTHQKLKSSYMAFFQIPKLPEWWLSRNDFRVLVERLKRLAHPGAFTDADFAIYREGWRRAGGITGMLNWYRAAARFPEKGPRVVIQPKTLLIWGTDDAVLGAEMVGPSIARCRDGRSHVISGAGHFVQIDAVEEVNRELISFLHDLHS